ncbi:PREDICTED: protein SPIRAL1-like 5 [Theobroma cacao]|uniref:Protein SPIRAL1-like 5 n=1 Tax=Theobroma cacao TaxID=3641 RepID=A0AB32VAR6_THECC|nr:PREDICTED: protein SPIRAL1-like 5 [Theobroma cacao]
MRRGESYGGGQSSLGYLFGSDEQPSKTLAPSTPIKAPWDDDNTTKKPPNNSSKKSSVTNNYHRAQGQNSGNFITDRPTTKVQSAPGGDSSLGYLFGDK